MKIRRKVKFAAEEQLQDSQPTPFLKPPPRHSSQPQLSPSVRKLPSSLVIPSSQTVGLKSAKQIERHEKYLSLLEVRGSAVREYASLMQIYETNEWKLRNIIQKELWKNKGYLYSRQVFAFIKTPDEKILRSLNFQFFRLDLLKITEFLTKFNAKKKIRQVEIIKDSMIAREEIIRNTATLAEYHTISQNMRSHPSMSQGFTIYDQLRQIRRSYNLPSSDCCDMGETFSKKITEAEETIFCQIENELSTRSNAQREMLSIVFPKKNKMV